MINMDVYIQYAVSSFSFEMFAHNLTFLGNNRLEELDVENES